MGKKNAPWSSWERLYYAESDLSERRKEALGRVWLVIETEVHDAGLANALRMAILQDILPDIAVYEIDDTEDDIDDEDDLVEGEE